MVGLFWFFIVHLIQRAISIRNLSKSLKTGPNFLVSFGFLSEIFSILKTLQIFINITNENALSVNLRNMHVHVLV